MPFVQTEYFPARIKGINTLVDLVHIHNDRDRYAARKTDLVEKKVAQTATPSELKELAELKRLAVRGWICYIHCLLTSSNLCGTS